MGAIAAIRVIYFTVGAEALRGTWVQTVCIVLTLVTIFMGSFMGCTENGLKKRLAYSSISQISYVLLGVFLMTPVGLLGGLLQLLFHALAKIGVFQSAGSIIFLTGTETIDGFPGLGRRIPVTMGCFAALALSLVGIPPFGGFFSKWYLALGALDGMSAPLCYHPGGAADLGAFGRRPICFRRCAAPSFRGRISRPRAGSGSRCCWCCPCHCSPQPA